MRIWSILLLVLLNVNCAVNYEKVVIPLIVKNVKKSLIEFNTDNVTTIGREITHNLKIMDELILTLEKADNYEKVFPKVVKTVNDLSKSYQKIADKKEVIRKTLNNRVNNIQRQRNLVRGKIGTLEKKIGTTRLELSRKTVDYQKAALESTIKFQEQELEVWKKFANGMEFESLISKLNDASGGINRFIDVLSCNSIVYTQAASTLNAIQDYKKANKDLQEVLAVVDLGNDLIQSWDKLAIVIDGAMQQIDEIDAINFGEAN